MVLRPLALARFPSAGQHEDLADWLQYHRQLGVDHFYVYDTGSKPPLRGVLQPFIEVCLLVACRLQVLMACEKSPVCAVCFPPTFLAGQRTVACRLQVVMAL